MKLKEIIKSAILVAVLAVCAQIIIPAGPIPFNLSVLAVLLIGGLLSPMYAALTIAVYILLGFAGLPIFAGWGSGFDTILGPTGGYIMSFLPMALVVSAFAKRNLILGIALAIAICHTMGTIWFACSRQIPMWGAFLAGSLPFVAFDLLKGVIAFLLMKRLRTHTI